MLQGAQESQPLTLQQLLQKLDPGELARASFQALAADMVASMTEAPDAAPPPAPASAANSSGVQSSLVMIQERRVRVWD